VAGLRAGRALPASLDEATARLGLGGGSRAAARDIAHGATRRLGTALALAGRLNARPPAPLAAALQLVALAELLAPGRRHEAVIVDQAVHAARADPDTAAAAGFLNATLRRFLREREPLLAAVAVEPQARWNHPDWWIDRLRADHPAHWEAVLAADAGHPPMTLRVNRRHGDTDAYAQRLAAAGMAAERIGPAALRLERPCDVAALPGFDQGDVSVQDLAAQMAAPLLAPRDGERVLDACAAPGGKTAHLLELADCRLLALDVDAARLARVGQNLARQRLSAELRCGDAAQPRGWWDGEPFDRILLDAPCSASGIVRRHPDIVWLRRRSDIATLARRQAQMLEALWGLLRPGGTLLYATCSVFRAEGEAMVADFCSQYPDARRQPLLWRWHGGNADHRVSHLLPQAAAGRNHDGFFYACLRKRD
jgi:16S rRNA (cytosine967-C5)-methyltransferase